MAADEGETLQLQQQLLNALDGVSWPDFFFWIELSRSDIFSVDCSPLEIAWAWYVGPTFRRTRWNFRSSSTLLKLKMAVFRLQLSVHLGEWSLDYTFASLCETLQDSELRF